MINQDTYTVPCICPCPEISNHSPNISPLKVTVPGSKSITNRALLLATLSLGISTLRGVLFSDDSRHFLKCIQTLGFETTVDETNARITVRGMSGQIPLKEASLYVGSAGTAARFLTACLGVSRGVYHMDASEQMRRRPMSPLLNSLRELGCEISFQEEEGHFPFTLKSNGFGQNHITVNIDHSSQFLSALLICSSLCKEDFTIQAEGTHGMSYIRITGKMMEQFGVKTDCPAPNRFVIKTGQHYHARDYQIEPDVSAACYYYAICPLLGIPVQVAHIHFNSLQGDVEFIRILERLGCHALDTPEGILLTPPDRKGYPGLTVDMSACSDQAITLAALAPFADGPTTITGIGHIRHQESDRISAIATELGRLGIRCTEEETSLTIYPGTPGPGLIRTYEDHRMAMGFSLIGLRCEGIIIDNPDCCRKTFEHYFEVLENAIQDIKNML
ncbi:MAG: 3-phosphoshikimate 1-carboxyvinyltransferase [Roseburia sp.]|nr:3-phosphoshikimate 1-carboxyvinyltransferase [Roseburia sp.]